MCPPAVVGGAEAAAARQECMERSSTRARAAVWRNRETKHHRAEKDLACLVKLGWDSGGCDARYLQHKSLVGPGSMILSLSVEEGREWEKRNGRTRKKPGKSKGG